MFPRGSAWLVLALQHQKSQQTLMNAGTGPEGTVVQSP